MSLRAQCQCGQLSVELSEGVTPDVVVCHCVDCQRRAGSPFGAGAYYQLSDVTITGEAKRYVRKGDSGADFTTCFCETCGSSVYWFSGKKVGAIGVAVGAVADADFTPPVRSVYECRKYDWVTLPDRLQRFDKGRTG